MPMPFVALHLSVLTALTPAAPVPSELAALRRLYDSKEQALEGAFNHTGWLADPYGTHAVKVRTCPVKHCKNFSTTDKGPRTKE